MNSRTKTFMDKLDDIKFEIDLIRNEIKEKHRTGKYTIDDVNHFDTRINELYIRFVTVKEEMNTSLN